MSEIELLDKLHTPPHDTPDMCGGKSVGDLETETETEGEQTISSACLKTSKIFLIITCILIWILGCGLISLGIYTLVVTPFIRPFFGVEPATVWSLVVAISGGLAFIAAIIGCIGAWRAIKCLMIFYLLMMATLLGIMLIGALLGWMFAIRNTGVAMMDMRKSLIAYNPRQGQASTINVNWDAMQIALKCCGVVDFNEWRIYNSQFRDANKVPQSCCQSGTDGQPKQGCRTTPNPTVVFSNGCFTKAAELVDKYVLITGIVAAGIALLMILGLVFGLLTYNRIRN